MIQATCVALLTPPGRGAVATLLIDGPSALTAVEQHFRPALRSQILGGYPLGRIVFGHWGDVTGEEIVACRISDEQIELSCHGGRLAAERIERDLAAVGCEAAAWPELVLNVVETEARLALAQARTERTAAILLDQLNGAMNAELACIEELREKNSQQARQRLHGLLERAPLGMHLVNPWRIVLAGRPNVGKSSLINALAGYARAIVFDEPGTTRDVVTVATALDGWPVELADTAGLRESADDLEAAGIARAREQMATADVLVLVFDRSQPWTPEDELLQAEWPGALVVFNKCDLPMCHFAAQRDAPRGVICHTSATTRQGINELVDALSRRLAPDLPPAGTAVPFTARQVRVIEALIESSR